MPAHIVFVRFFVGYTASFPYERFVCLKDGDLDEAVETLRQEWWRDPANRARFETWYIETERQRIESNIRLDGRPYHGAPKLKLPANMQNLSVMLSVAPNELTRTPIHEQIARCAGWGAIESEPFPPHCISPRYPVARYATKQLADDVATALNSRVSELTAGAAAKHNRNDLEFLLRFANPRFVAVSEKTLTRPEIVTSREQIQRLRTSVSGTPTVQERYVRTYWDLIQPTLDISESLSVAEVKLPEQDGPFGTDGFRFRGIEVLFGRAALQRKLVLSLWDENNHSPRDARLLEDVVSDVYGEENETSDTTFRQLCFVTKRRFQTANLSLSFDFHQGKIQLSASPD